MEEKSRIVSEIGHIKESRRIKSDDQKLITKPIINTIAMFREWKFVNTKGTNVNVFGMPSAEGSRRTFGKKKEMRHFFGGGLNGRGKFDRRNTIL
jgi:hypothetical protein